MKTGEAKNMAAAAERLLSHFIDDMAAHDPQADLPTIMSIATCSSPRSSFRPRTLAHSRTVKRYSIEPSRPVCSRAVSNAAP